MSESAFLARLHARFAVPRAVVVRLAERATGHRVVDLRRVMRGYDNEVYRVELTGDLAVYVRIPGPGKNGFVHEAWAMEQARGAGVPVPEVLLIDTVRGEASDADEADERHAMVLAEAPGRQLGTVLASLSTARRRAAMVNVGRVLARLHSVRTPGVWRPGDDGTWPDPADLRRGFVADRTAERPQLSAAGLTPEEVDNAIALLGASSATPPPDNFVLCHGDVSPEHVFVDAELRVCGLIDWGMWHGGSPIGELAYVAMVHEETDLTAVVEGHTGGSLDEPAFRRPLPFPSRTR
ncbi:phosphotransferase family protein [Actinopolymorpha rutila]|uniref:Aminoglycoside phosphotransferase (APT) family kinase protein n=1 Tax=Actinopolymorpha rutila TaxID=446787 RepID=A0A852Z747_9ACTN|nr:phosphotransferase [Actinopolymorpha rutila]NYH87702.1 aminoglycoside phosphotransferase (APT) family kinase protein [Actinopolymorpha rutila]